MSYKSRLLLFCFVLMPFFWAQASNVSIHFAGAEGQQVTIHAYEDLMNYQQVKVDQSVFSTQAKVSFEVNLLYTQKLVIRVGYVRFSFFAEPNQNYQIEVDTMDFSNPAMYPIQVVNYITPHYEIRVEEGENINEQLNNFSTQYNKFYNRNYIKIYRKQNTQQVVDSAQLIVNQYVESTDNDYIKTHVNMQIGQLELMSRKLSPQQMVEKYFTEDKIQYRNLAYMDFFNMYWRRYLLTKAKGFTRDEFDTIVNHSRSLTTLDALLAKDPLLQDSTLRQLVLLRNLQDMYVSRSYLKESIQILLMDISAHPRHPEHLKIAVGMRAIFESYQKGSKAPELSLTGFDGKPISLDDYKGKYVVLSTFNLNCLECLAELNNIVELNEEFDDIIQFVSISFDQNTKQAEEYVKLKEYKWVFASYSHDFIDAYGISMLPVFILIDKEGNVEDYACPLPSQYFQDYFIQMLNEKKGNLD